MTYIAGISAYYHDSAVALIQDGHIIAAAQEERFSRRKHDPRFPEQALKYCLAEGGVRLEGLDYVVFYDKLTLLWEIDFPHSLGLPYSAFTYYLGFKVNSGEYSVFLRMIASFQYGTNLSLWSLANEFWYYILLPCLAGALRWRGKRRWWALAGVVLVVILFLVSAKTHDPERPRLFFFYLIIWMTGAGAALTGGRWRTALGWSGLAYAGVSGWRHGFVDPTFRGDAGTAALVLGVILLSHAVPARWIAAPSRFLAGYSYSLYAIHLPVVVCLLSFDSCLHDKVAFGFRNYLRFAGYVAVANLAAVIFWSLTERHTNRIRRYWSDRFGNFQVKQ